MARRLLQAMRLAPFGGAWSHDEVAHPLRWHDGQEEVIDELAVASCFVKLAATNLVAAELLKKRVLRALHILQECLIGIRDPRDKHRGPNPSIAHQVSAVTGLGSELRLATIE